MESRTRRTLLSTAIKGTVLAAPGALLSRPLFAASRKAASEGRPRLGDVPAPDVTPEHALSAVANCSPLLEHALRPLTGGETTPLCTRFSNDVLLIVNTASRCGFTPQFEALEALHQRFSDRGFKVLGFPSDDFRQELADEAEVAEFCRLNYGVTFPMFQKVHVRGEQAHPLFRDLAQNGTGFPNWNFNKYVVDRQGQVVARFEASEQPLGERLTQMIETLL